MLGFLKGSKEKTLTIEGTDKSIQMEKKETILNAALRQGVRFPHSCRVGGCATCKCKLVSGKVKELTESAYILEADELAQGYILACQAVPKSDVTIELDNKDSLDSEHELVTTFGTISDVKSLTHDISAVTIDIENPIKYSAGQYALVSVPGKISEGRSYSFATAPSVKGDSQVSFYIRKVPGGEMSTWAQDKSIVGTQVEVSGPYGDFYLRESDKPILCVAGGSGLAPIKSLLEDALQFKCSRDVVFLFGARTQEDLYCLNEINRIATEWPANFKFVPVLSEEPKSSGWEGKTGLVTEFIKDSLLEGSEIYMCGPPPMLDAAEVELLNLGVDEADIYSDKFTDKSFVKTA